MNIFKTRDNTLTLWDLTQWLNNHSDVYGNRIGISWKIGKRRKLRTYRISWEIWECDCCGKITSVELTKAGKTFKLDNHFGPSSMSFNTL